MPRSKAGQSTTKDTAELATPTRAPTLDELQQAPAVLQALEHAWLDSLSGIPAERHEEGGWIYLNLKTGELTAAPAPRGLRAELEISSPPLFPDCVIVATFHTHPNPTSEGWDPGPSDTDEEVLTHLGAPGLIRPTMASTQRDRIAAAAAWRVDRASLCNVKRLSFTKVRML